MSETSSAANREQELERVLADYLHAVESGTPPDRAELLRQHSDLAADLDSFFRNRDALERIAEPLKQQAPDAETIGIAATANGGTTLRYFGDYELLDEIARGGMGVVYTARQVSLGRIVAVKMILTGQLASDADVARFRAEAEAAAKLDDPNIVPIYEIGTHEGQHYFSMKLIEGGSLAADRRSARTDYRSTAKRVTIVARAVHHAHQRGILHRDLKPGNILIDAAGQPHVTDFGLARRVEGGSDLTRSGAIVGTPSYMAPEQARSEKVLTTGTDVYGLGAVLYELLTGRPPFRAETPLETLMQVIEREPPRPRALNAQVPRDLETICMKCLEKDARRRYGSAEALADDLERWLVGEPIRARQTPAWERAGKWARRRPAIAALLLVSATAMVLLVAGLFWSNASIRAEEERTRKALERVQEEAVERARAEAKALAALRNEECVSYANGVARAYAEWQAHHPHLAARVLDRCQANLRGWEWQYVDRVCRPEVLSVPSWGLGVAYSPDGRFLVTGAAAENNAAGVWLFDAATGKQLRRLGGLANHPCRFAFSADGRTVAAAPCRRIGGGDAKVWEVATGKVLFSHSSPQIDDMALSPDGHRIYLSEGTGKSPVSGYTVADGKKFLSIADEGGRALNPVALTADGKRLAVASVIYDALTGAKLVACSPRRGGIAQLAFSPDGRRLAAAVNPVIVWDATTGKQLFAVRGDFATAIAFSADSQHLAVGSKNDLRMLAADTGDEQFALRNVLSREVTGIAFHASGTRVAVSGLINEAAKVLNVDARAVYTIEHRSHDLAENGWEPDSLAFSPDGHAIASIVAGATTVRLLDLVTAREVGIVQFGKDRPDDRFLRLVYRPDGHLLALCTTAARDKTHGLQVRDLTAGRTLCTVRASGLDSIGESVTERWVCFSADGSRLAVALRSSQSVELWDVQQGKIIGGLPAGSYHAGVLQLSPDGRRLAVTRMMVVGKAPETGPGTMGIHLYDAETGTLILSHGSTALTFSPDSKQVAIYDKDNVILFDATTGQELRTLANAGLVQAFSPDSRLLATTRGVWDATTGKALCTWELNTWARGAFSPDGRRLAVRGNGFERDQVEIWDAQTGHQTLTLRDLSRPIARLYFSRDSHQLVAIDDMAIHIWNARPLGDAKDAGQ